jgi:hypothetical protein
LYGAGDRRRGNGSTYVLQSFDGTSDLMGLNDQGRYFQGFYYMSTSFKQAVLDKVGAYWAKALQINPNLHFELITTLFGVNSITLYYKGSRGLSAEVFHINPEGLVQKAYAHYAFEL